ncbi:TetR family transcriptional regulator [Acinetobacter seifertii]|uniref:TetR family transcriptional regulator n=1 Tax=Acinetobacter seifertii TaxID=1530123 RepID=A0A7H2PDB0_9GAMM|nr:MULTISPECIES: TetR/AcrR family transcriptional regulator [Acinetobacter]MDQ9038253.1 TetR/AcrR family transcriptional regulator [Acinetobacter seifertii]MEB3794464.1 TetR/AcrR family transcriptional regulator [Acinetobacter sp. IK24]MEB3813586.1 TetR/AcrR family transcriptional regulator [Acinetobacter sp. IK22]MEB3832748.1 TetR/AcrR family transcriptional regulator [Acinetobacter sp. IK23]MEB3835775.1 TetR/AcrR family transcriptional regulator [Acinetobacter sp. IK25]
MSINKTALKPRKSPVQARSTATIEVLHEATIQVLLKEGIVKCNTTRIAERAGVSVGSIYQYYPNRDSLLAAVLQRHLDSVAEKIEELCLKYEKTSIKTLISALVDEIILAKLSNPEESKALYAISGERGGLDLSKRMNDRMLAAISNLLESASDIEFDDSQIVAEFVLGAIMGLIRRVLENQVTDKVEQVLESHLKLMVVAYLQQIGHIKN